MGSCNSSNLMRSEEVHGECEANLEAQSIPLTHASSSAASSSSSSSSNASSILPSSSFPSFLPIPTPSTSAMVRWLESDQDSVSCLIGLLSLREIASLHASCTAWKHSIEHPPHMPQRRDRDWSLLLDLNSPDINELIACRWFQPFVTKVYAFSIASRTLHIELDRLLVAMSHFNRLSDLHLDVELSQIPLANLTNMIQSLANSLTCLALTNAVCNPYSQNHMEIDDLDSTTRQLMRERHWKVLSVCQVALDEIGNHLHRLTDLHIDSSCPQLAKQDSETSVKYQSLSFARLKKLRHLKLLYFKPLFHCSRAQMFDLIEITTLTNLTCGKWTSAYSPQQDVDSRSVQQWIDSGVALLHQIPHLMEIGGCGLTIGAESVDWQCIPHVKKITSLTKIQLQSLQIDYDFLQSLANLKFVSYFGVAAIEDHFRSSKLPSCLQKLAHTIMSLSALTELHLSNCAITCEDLSLILCTGISQLSLRECRLESPSPKAFATAKPSLHTLVIVESKDMFGARCQWVKLLPSMSHLKFLRIFHRSAPTSGDISCNAEQDELRKRMPNTRIKVLSLER